jgi:alpha-tubulin suppressor-like RCC1 family protein
MLRRLFYPARLFLPGLLVVILLVQACSSEATEPSNIAPNPGFALTVGASTISLSQGGSASTSIKATRSGGLTAAIMYTISAAPAGLSASVATTSVADSVTLTLTASGTLAAETYQIVVNATAAGAPAQQSSVAVTVSAPAGGNPAIEMVAAGAHTCGLTNAATAYCWGYNADGQLGDNDTSLVNPTPVAVAGGLRFKSLSVSKVEGVTCGLTTTGAAYCWGDNDDGQLGDRTRTRRLTPTPVAGGLTFKSLSVGTVHVCGVATSGTAYCWGFSGLGAFGDGSTGLRVEPAVSAPGMTFDSIVAGQDFTCALTPEGAAYCWGRGTSGELGNGSATNSTTPVAVAGGLTFRSLVAGGLAVCGLTTDGQAYCWGSDFFGTLGDGSSATDDGVTRRVAPVPVAGGLTFQNLSTGYQTVCGVTVDGVGYCWGYNNGAVGDGTLGHRSRPTAVAGGLTFFSIAAGTGQSCGVTITDALYCWGDNSNGELGDGTTSPHSSPALVRWP